MADNIENHRTARAELDATAFNGNAALPYDLQVRHLQAAMQDVYDFFYDVNTLLIAKGLHRLEEMLRPAAMSGIISDMLTASVARQSRTLVENTHFNGHPDLLIRGRYPNDGVAAGEEGVEIKSTRKAGGAVDTHGARDQWMCVFVYEVAYDSAKPAHEQAPMRFTEVYLGHVTKDDFRRNKRGELGTKTATLHKEGIAKLRRNWVYRLPKNKPQKKTSLAQAKPTAKRSKAGRVAKKQAK